LKRGDLIDVGNKPTKNVLSPVDEGDAATKEYVDSKTVGRSDLNMNEHSIRHTNPNPTHEDEVVPKQWIENNFLSRDSPASTKSRDLNIEQSRDLNMSSSHSL